mmetsp:Transcript_35587/g.65102  ORF Transcript_35587/g.65102 Transcript_35587/m.65102 type:complete len:203 (+) Transcript_35587:256-864(+)
MNSRTAHFKCVSAAAASAAATAGCCSPAVGREDLEEEEEEEEADREVWGWWFAAPVADLPLKPDPPPPAPLSPLFSPPFPTRPLPSWLGGGGVDGASLPLGTATGAAAASVAACALAFARFSNASKLSSAMSLRFASHSKSSMRARHVLSSPCCWATLLSKVVMRSRILATRSPTTNCSEAPPPPLGVFAVADRGRATSEGS